MNIDFQNHMKKGCGLRPANLEQMSKGNNIFGFGVMSCKNTDQEIQIKLFDYILNQQKDSLMHNFFQAQFENPSKGDWVSEEIQWIGEYDIAKSIQEVKTVKKSICKKKIIITKFKKKHFSI